MNKNPSDGYILDMVFKSYYEEFISYGNNAELGESRIYVPIDIEAMAIKLRMDKHLLFGRLYYHLDKKYRYEEDNGNQVHLFKIVAGKDRNAVNFPLLAAISAEHTKSFLRFILPAIFSFCALIISSTALFYSVT